VGFGEGEKECERKSSRALIYSSLEEAEREYSNYSCICDRLNLSGVIKMLMIVQA
jgi:hypothetical protein